MFGAVGQATLMTGKRKSAKRDVVKGDKVRPNGLTSVLLVVVALLYRYCEKKEMPVKSGHGAMGNRSNIDAIATMQYKQRVSY